MNALLCADYKAGERFWKFWVSNTVEGVSIRLLSKRCGDGTFEAVVIFEDNVRKCRKAKRKRAIPNDAKLVAVGEDFVRTISDERMKIALHDFSDCETMQQFEYRVREGTLWSIVREEVR